VILPFVMAVFIAIRHAYSLEHSIYDNKCRDVTQTDSKKGSFVGISVSKCVEKCWLRRQCKSAIYKRLYQLCEVYDVDVSTSEPERLDTSCAVIKRNDIVLDGTEVVIKCGLQRIKQFQYNEMFYKYSSVSKQNEYSLYMYLDFIIVYACYIYNVCKFI